MQGSLRSGDDATYSSAECNVMIGRKTRLTYSKSMALGSVGVKEQMHSGGSHLGLIYPLVRLCLCTNTTKSMGEALSKYYLNIANSCIAAH